jgi:hypothetical protein
MHPAEARSPFYSAKGKAAQQTGNGHWIDIVKTSYETPVADPQCPYILVQQDSTIAGSVYDCLTD